LTSTWQRGKLIESPKRLKQLQVIGFEKKKKNFWKAVDNKPKDVLH